MLEFILADEGNHRDLYLDVFGKGIHPYRFSGREIPGEAAAIHLIDSVKIFPWSEKDIGLDDIGKAGAGCSKDSCQIGHNQFGLLLQSPVNGFLGSGIDSDLTAEVGNSIDDDCLRIRSDGLWSLVGIDDGTGHGVLFCTEIRDFCGTMEQTLESGQEFFNLGSGKKAEQVKRPFRHESRTGMKAKYDLIGKNYNRTRRPDPHLLSRLKHHLQPEPDGLYLDIGCGTGNYTIALASSGGRFIGVDPSEKMLEKARRKNKEIDWRRGVAESVPVADASIDGVMGTLTTHHWKDLEQGFKELYRVMKSGARLVIFTATPDQMDGYWLKHYFPKMLADSKVFMPTLEKTLEAAEIAGFTLAYTEPYFIHSELEDLFLYSGKHNPELYFEEAVRNGISSFSALANAEEVQTGLAKLRKDIDDSQIEAVMGEYVNEDGDYLYLVFRK